MTEQGFVLVDHSFTEIFEFCNKMEYAEVMTGKNNSQTIEKQGSMPKPAQ